jgi:hypothetical protein
MTIGRDGLVAVVLVGNGESKIQFSRMKSTHSETPPDADVYVDSR